MNEPLTTYLPLATEYYDYRKKITQAEFDFYMTYAQQAAGPVLEPMCGTGRLLIPLLHAGIPIEGFDASPHMLNALHKKYASYSNQPAPVWQSFVEHFSKPQQYRLIFIPFGSWGLITNAQAIKKSLDNIYRHLAPGGIFIVEIDTIHSVPTTINTWQRDSITRPDNSHLTLHTFQTYDETTQLYRCQCRYESERNNHFEKIEKEDFYQYLYRPNEMDALLDEAGFTITSIYQDFYRTLATSKAPLSVYIATNQ